MYLVLVLTNVIHTFVYYVSGPPSGANKCTLTSLMNYCSNILPQTCSNFNCTSMPQRNAESAPTHYDISPDSGDILDVSFARQLHSLRSYKVTCRSLGVPTCTNNISQVYDEICCCCCFETQSNMAFFLSSLEATWPVPAGEAIMEDGTARSESPCCVWGRTPI